MADMEFIAMHEFGVATRGDRVGLAMRGAPDSSKDSPLAAWTMSPEQAKELCIQLALAAIELGVDPRGPDLPFQDQSPSMN